jgi:Lrp/AsnC family transcriptional regulator
MAVKIDDLDRRILRELQADATISIAELSARVRLSQTPCWKRVQKLEGAGVIKKRVALIAQESIGLALTVLVAIEAGAHSDDWLRRFTEAVAELPEVIDFYRMAGDVDYELRVVVADMEAYDAFYKRLIALAPIRNVTSRFVMERIKTTTELPVRLERELVA